MHEYFEQIKRVNEAWPVYTQDLLPTLTDMSEYWSGFYTTDPGFKSRVHDYTEITRSMAGVVSLQKFTSLDNNTVHIDNM